MKKLRIYSCTPVRFPGDELYFLRESGMFCRGLQEIGIDSKAVMPGPPMSSDLPDIIRTEYVNLESSEWWKEHNLDGVILYSWAAPRYNGVVESISRAGIPVCVVMDTDGLISRQANSIEWYRRSWEQTFVVKDWMRETLKQIIDNSISYTAKRRVLHYMSATAVTVPTPLGVLWVKREAATVGTADLAERIFYLPHPQSSIFRYSMQEKSRIVFTVARWLPEDWPQKNPLVLIETYRRFLGSHPDWKGLIVGRGASSLVQTLGLKAIAGLDFCEQMCAEDLSVLMSKARIGFWSSRWEGQQGTAAQALCCGCSVVSHSSPHMTCFRHYVSRSSGRLATRNESSALADELTLEAASWENGERDPERISAVWCAEFHAKHVAERAVSLLGY